MQIAAGLCREPAAPFPRMFDEAGLEGFYRFVNNDEVGFDELVEAHGNETAGRARQLREVIVVHDTTELVFDDGIERRGIGQVRRSPGFLAHVSLAVSSDGSAQPLGVLHASTIVRPKPANRRTQARMSGADSVARSNRESLRWGQHVEVCQARLQGDARAIHVGDREADAFVFLEQLVAHDLSFVVRARHDRILEDEQWGHLSDALGATTLRLRRSVRLSARKGRTVTHGKAPRFERPQRIERDAELTISTTTVHLRPPPYLKRSLPIEVNVVHVLERDPPDDQEPVEWILFTSEPVHTRAAVERIVDAYRTRWLIEEFFKALKTGCRFQERQLESLDALLVTLALFFPVACKLLELRALSRDEDASARAALSPLQIDVLRAACPKARLPAQPTAKQALLAIAQLGGHQKNNGPPGWQVLGRGFEALLALEQGWTLARQSAEM